MLFISVGFFIVLTVVGFLYRYSRKQFLKRLVLRQLQQEFYDEVQRRVRAQFILTSPDEEVMKALLEGENAVKPNAYTRWFDETWEQEHAKMLKEDRFGLPK